MNFLKKDLFLCGASVTGPGHIAKGIVNQDSFLCINKRKYMLFVVSDGMGSKPFADLGSKKACEAVAEEIAYFVKHKENPLSSTQLFSNIVVNWKISLAPLDAKKCSATCLFAFVTKSKIFTAALGDGMICLLGREHSQSIVVNEEKEGSFSNTTFSLSDSGAAGRFRYGFYDRALFKGIVLTTDGISADLETGKELSFAEDIFEETKKLFFLKRKSFLTDMMNNFLNHNWKRKDLLKGMEFATQNIPFLK